MSKSERVRFAEEAPPTTYAYYKDGRVKTQSITKRMKESQEYPDEYGSCMVDSFLKWREHQQCVDECGSSSESDFDYDDAPASWREAGLTPILKSFAKTFPGCPGHF